jgi:hypothetical protein
MAKTVPCHTRSCVQTSSLASTTMGISPYKFRLLLTPRADMLTQAMAISRVRKCPRRARSFQLRVTTLLPESPNPGLSNKNLLEIRENNAGLTP